MKLFLKPAPGLSIPIPGADRDLDPSGEEVDTSRYWRQRLADGDVVESAPKSPAKKAKE